MVRCCRSIGIGGFAEVVADVSLEAAVHGTDMASMTVGKVAVAATALGFADMTTATAAGAAVGADRAFRYLIRDDLIVDVLLAARLTVPT